LKELVNIPNGEAIATRRVMGKVLLEEILIFAFYLFFSRFLCLNNR
jgi:hypothetical protein